MQGFVSELEEKKLRIGWIDIVKGINIILVIIGHTCCAQTHAIYSFHMALFAICTGLTIKKCKREELLQKTIGDAKRLLVPFFSILCVDDLLKLILWKKELKIVTCHFFMSF